MSWLQKIPTSMLIILAVLMALAPFPVGDAPWQPHLWEKLGMLINGTLRRPIDIFDLLFHAAPLILLLLKFKVMRAAADSRST